MLCDCASTHVYVEFWPIAWQFCVPRAHRWCNEVWLPKFWLGYLETARLRSYGPKNEWLRLLTVILIVTFPLARDVVSCSPWKSATGSLVILSSPYFWTWLWFVFSLTISNWRSSVSVCKFSLSESSSLKHCVLKIITNLNLPVNREQVSKTSRQFCRRSKATKLILKPKFELTHSNNPKMIRVRLRPSTRRRQCP